MSNYDSDQDVTNRKASPKSKFVEPDNKSASGSVTDSNARKRTSAEPIDYPRRRATIACEICRSRKSRCDGAKPKCRLCTELSAECVYREPGVKLDAGDKLILERLSRIESLLTTNQTSEPGSVVRSPASGSSPNVDRTTLLTKAAGALNSLGTWSALLPTVSTKPKKHTAPASTIYDWPKIRDLVRQDWNQQVLAQLEMQREPLITNIGRPLDFTNTQLFIQSFFNEVNVWYACVSPYKWHAYYRIAHAQSFRDGPESCLVLLVLALGAASCNRSISRLAAGIEPSGYPLFCSAWAMLPSIMTRTDVIALQCQWLACAYLFYLVRPLEAWNLLVSLSMKLQLIVSSPSTASDKRVSERLYWNVFLLESDLLAELELPRSEVDTFEESVALPGPFESDGEPPIAQDDFRFLLAVIGLRKLVNRANKSISSISSPITNMAALEPLVDDLEVQLSHWYDGLPGPLKFELHTGRSPNATPAQIALRLRFFACRTIIYRPYVLAVLVDESAMQEISVKNGCRKCLEACIRQLENITAHHAGHLPYLWQGALSIVSQTLLVMGSTLSPSLAELLPPPHQMNAIIDDVVREIEHHAHLAPSLGLSAEIVREAEKRRRAMLLTMPLNPRSALR